MTLPRIMIEDEGARPYPAVDYIRFRGQPAVAICAECGFRPPKHAYFCAGAHTYTRAQVLREMVRLDDELRTATTNTRRFLIRGEFWSWSYWLGFEYWESTREQRDEIRAEVDRERRRMTPPWKRRSSRHPSTASPRGSRP